MHINFDINNFIKDFSSNCSKVQIKSFSKSEVITTYIQKRNQFSILVEGSADLVRYDYKGNKTKVIDLNSRLELLTKRSIRDKLLGYFNILSTRSFSRTFSLPFSLTYLADYLSIDRSAMMREIKLLKDDGIIKKNGNKITLLYS